MSDAEQPRPATEITEARSTASAKALQAALNGASVSEAYRKAGITLPSAGTPVINPIPASAVQAGDVGVYKDHLVIAVGNDTVLSPGEQQTIEAARPGPNFLGWFDPTA